MGGMIEVLLRLVWFAAVTAVIAYGSVLAVGTTLKTKAENPSPVVVLDTLGPGTHHLSGMVMVSSLCDDLSLRTQQMSTTTYMLRFRTWTEPSARCLKVATPRSFHEVVFAPSADVEFFATLDDKPISIQVLPVITDH